MNFKFLAFRILAITIMTVMVFACDKDEEPLEAGLEKNEFLIFGEYAGFCVGESCVEIFKIENGKLYEDFKDLYPSAQETGYLGEYSLLSNAKYELAIDLIHQFPGELKENVNLVIGMPDAYDQGGIYVEIMEGDKTYYWLIDRDTRNIPEYLHDWVNLVQERIDQINN